MQREPTMDRAPWFEANAGAGRLEVLWEDGERVFCRTWRDGSNGRQPCMAVVPAAEHPAPGSIERLTHEYALRDYLDHEWAARPIELRHERGRPVLLLELPVLEPAGGCPLDRFVGQAMGVQRFLQLAIAVSAALRRMHGCGLVHKDIKPSNILIDPATDQIWLTGFGIASRLFRERPSREPPELIAGSLAYMAPEQTGRMNRSIDSRCDLYSLGVTLYELLTGSLPFTASDPMEWVHCHIARRPAKPKARFEDVPSQVSTIIMKLLAKTPDDRYQTAQGVEHDLRRCLADWNVRRAIADFPLGERDIADRLLIPEQLYGRENEVDVLLEVFDQVMASGTPRLVLVRGHPGIGKSALVNELHRVLVPPRGLFASGKFDQHGRDVPYASLAEAFQSLVRRLLGKPDAELRRWRDELRQALHPNAQLVVNLIPDLRLIIGEQPDVVEVPPSAAKARFQVALRRLLGVFARRDHPLALFLDDLQWIDAATLDVVGELLVQPDQQYLLLVGAYRDNEVDSAHPLMRKLASIRESGASVQEIALGPLKPDDLTRLIVDALHCEPRDATPLAGVIHEKTAGNPFFVNRFIETLVEERLIAFDSGLARWSWDLRSIQVKGHSENVVDLMVGKLSRLPPTTQAILKQLACLGSTGDSSTLAMVHEASEDEIHSRLWEALRLELIVRSEHGYRFAHDRIQEAAYVLIPEGLRAHMHLRIGRSLSGHFTEARREEAAFLIVGQLNRAHTLIVSHDEREELAALNLVAAKRAKAAAAYASALTYSMAGAALVAGDCWDRRHHLLFELELLRAECEFLTGQIAGAEKRLLALQLHLADTLERALVALLLADIYVALQRLERSVAVCLEYLGQAGFDIPMQPTEVQARSAYDHVWSVLDGRSIEQLVEVPVMTDPAPRATLDVLAKLVRCALAQMDENLLCVVLSKAVVLSLEHGHCDSSCYVYEYFGFIAGWQFGDFEAGFRFGRLGHELVHRKGLHQHEALVCLTLANRVMPWVKHVGTCRALIHEAFELANKSGDRVSAVSSCCVLVSNLLMAGEPLVEVERVAEAGQAFCRRAAFGDFIDAADTQAAFIRNLRGLTRQFGSFDDDAFDERSMQRKFATQPHAPVFECWYWIRKLQAHFFAGEYVEALAASLRARALLSSSRALLETAEYELYSALSHAAACDGASSDERQQHVASVATHHRQLELWARHCPENFENSATLVAAELARIDGPESNAMRLYEQAIRSARDSGFVHHEALATELAARFYGTRGFERIAKTSMRDARACYLQWGAQGKVRQLERDGLLEVEAPRVGATLTAQTPVERLDLATVLKVLQAVSGEIELEKLIATVMRLGLSHAGAERGLLILPSGDGYRIEAEVRIDGEALAVALRQVSVTTADLPQSMLQYVIRTREHVLLHDASVDGLFLDDEYLRGQRARSILCMPLLKQTRLVGVIYLENNLVSGVFTPAKMAVLQLLASEAAISLENSRLYRELQEREMRVRRLVDSNIVGIVIASLDGSIIDANEAFLRIVGYDRDDLDAGVLRWTELTPAEWRETDEQRMAGMQATGIVEPYEKEFLRKDGTRVPVLVGGALFDGQNEGVGFIVDLTDRKRAEGAARESERRYHEIRMQLAHANRVATVGQLSAAIVHEVNQPLAGILMNASTCLRMLAADPPNIVGASKTARRAIRDANRASDVIGRLRALFAKTETRTETLDLNGAIREVLALSRAELQSHRIVVRLRFADDLPPVIGDRIQLQQLLLNLIKNAADSMSTSEEGPRELAISTEATASDVMVAVEDTGPGLSTANLEHIFEPFYSTKAGGLGVGLSICRAIVEAHRGRLWVQPAVPNGAVFQFTLPAARPNVVSS
jgi:PAS domain S-box-containing protein